MHHPSDALAPARDGEDLAAQADGQDWLVSWHPPPTPPAGRPHGASGVCVTDTGGIVLISGNGRTWGLPGGRPEGDESWEDTLRREMLEETCATVLRAELLGYSRGRCVRGHEAGLVIVRSWWRAEVELGLWDPRFEVPYRRVVPPGEVWNTVRDAEPDGFHPILLRILREAGVSA